MKTKDVDLITPTTAKLLLTCLDALDDRFLDEAETLAFDAVNWGWPTKEGRLLAYRKVYAFAKKESQ